MATGCPPIIEETLTTDHLFETSWLDESVRGVIGADMPRIDGPLKGAPYTAEYHIDNPAYGYLAVHRG